MSSHHAGSRFAGPPWRLAVVLLSGIFVLITGAVPASATPAESSTDTSVGADTEQTGAAVVGAHERPDAVAGAAYPGNDTDAPPPPSSYVDVTPLDRVAPHHRPAPAEHLLPERAGSAADPDRGPPA